ncbi:MAG: alginate lyase family protein [Fimbriimonadaceae bacterium]|nr:alginate lyase family protein [Fimbriimonadaceae bacterium]
MVTWLALLLAAPEANWDVRLGQQIDQTAEYTAAGYTPHWEVDWIDRARPEVTWADDAQGDCRGWLVFARPYTVPTPAPAALELQAEYRSRCALDGPLVRSGRAAFLTLSPAAWQALTTDPARAPVLDSGRPPGVLAWADVLGQGPDVLEWRSSGPQELVGPWAEWAGQTVMLGWAWGCNHMGQAEEGALRDLTVRPIAAADQAWSLFEALDLERPALAPVRAAVAARDLPEAEAALARHLRERREPHVANPPAAADARGLAAADEVLARTYRLAGCPAYTFPEQIVWNADPFNYEQWAIALNRHYQWNQLASAWLATKDPKYAQEWQRQVVDWVAKMPVHIGRNWIQGPYNAGVKSPLSLDAGIRMGQTWFQSLEVLRQAPEVADATIVTMLRSLWQHGRYLLRPSNYKRGSNWGCMESNGLYHLGVLLPEFREAATWKQTALERITAELDLQVYPDGAQTELAPGYHGVSLTNFLGVLYLARANGEAVPERYVAGLERMYDYYLRLRKPNGQLPPLNDSGNQDPTRNFRDAVALFPQREEFRWGLSRGAEGRPPDYTSVAFDYAGWVVMRSGWRPQDLWALFGAGPFGTGHQHEDKLAVLLHALERDLVTEAGVYAYDESAWRKYVLSTRGHSTVRVDGQDQNCRATPAEYLATQPDRHGFRSDARFDYARDSHTAGYGTPAVKSLVHRRRVLLVKPDYLLVVDDYQPTDGRPHRATAQFLLSAPSAVVGAGGETLSAALDNGARVAVLPLHRAAQVTVVQGQREPEVLGFVPEGFEKLRPAPAVLDTAAVDGPTLRAWLLLPFRGEQCPVRLQREPGPELRVTVEWGQRRDRLEVTPTLLRAVVGDERFEQAELALAGN